MITLTSTLSNKESVTTLSKACSFVRWAVWALPVCAALLFFSTITHQPDPQTDFAGFAGFATTSQFFISHLLLSIGGAAIGSIGVIGFMFYLQGTRAAGKAITGATGRAEGRR